MVKLPYLAYLAELGATDLHPLGERATGRLVAALRPQHGERLLAVGCGRGRTMARQILSAGVHVDGVDVLPSMLRVARRRLQLTGAASRSALALASGSALPWATGSYHAVYTESVLGFQDAGTARRMLAELRRVLQPGGRYVANEAVWKRGSDPAAAAAVYAAAVADFGSGPASPQFWTVDDWTRVMEEAGFQVACAMPLAETSSAVTEPVDRPWRLQLSTMLTAFYRLRGLLLPRLLRQRLRYRLLLAGHAHDGRYTESWLFELRRPPGR
mgnify:FL=1